MEKTAIFDKKEMELLEKAALSLFTQPSRAEQFLAHFNEKKAIALPLREAAQYWRMRGFIENLHLRLENAEAYFNKALGYAEQVEAPESLIQILVDLAGVQINKRNWNEAEKNLKTAEDYSSTLRDAPLLKARIACRMGYVNLHYERNETTVDYFLKAEKYFTEAGDSLSVEDAYFLALTSSGLGNLYSQLNDSAQSIAAFLKTLDIYEEYGLNINRIWQFLNAGNGYLAINELDKAAYYFKKTNEQISEGAAADRARGSASTNLAIVYIQQKNLAAATDWLNQAEQLLGVPEQEEDYTNLSILELQRARIFIALQAPDSAALHLDKAEYFANKGADLHNLQNICHAKADFWANQGNFKKAYAYRTAGSELALLHLERTREEQIRELQIKHQAEQREHDSRVARLQLTGLQLKALRVQMNPHFIFNALNAIQSFINSNRSEEAAIWLARFSKLMRKALDLSDLEQIDLEDEISFLTQYLELNKKLRFRDAFTYEIIVEKEVSNLYPEIPAMVVQPFVENAIEHGLRPLKGGRLEVRFSYLDESSVRCTVKDNGIGLRPQKVEKSSDKHRSKGVLITKERLSLLFAERGRKGVFVQIQDRNELTDGKEEGVVAEIILPIFN